MRFGRTVSSISFSRNAASYFRRPAPGQAFYRAYQVHPVPRRNMFLPMTNCFAVPLHPEDVTLQKFLNRVGDSSVHRTVC